MVWWSWGTVVTVLSIWCIFSNLYLLIQLFLCSHTDYCSPADVSTHCTRKCGIGVGFTLIVLPALTSSRSCIHRRMQWRVFESIVHHIRNQLFHWSEGTSTPSFVFKIYSDLFWKRCARTSPKPEPCKGQIKTPLAERSEMPKTCNTNVEIIPLSQKTYINERRCNS